MAFEKDNIHINTFSGGLDTDTAFPNLANTKYFAANNVSLIGDGKFTTLQNIKGTTKLTDITGVTNTDVLGVFESNYIIGTTENVKCLTIMTATLGGNFNIYAYDLNNNVLYSIYQEATTSDYHTSDRVIDGVVFAERGFDILYFTDNYNQPRKLKCVIPSVYTPNFLLVGSLTVLRPRAIGRITLDNVTSGGTLLTGTYQVAYQLINIPENRYSAFSLLTNPIHVYTTDSNGFVVAGVGLQSNKKIVVTVAPTEDELVNYTHYRLAIVENINAEGVVDLNVDLSNITPIGSLTYEINSNAAFDQTTIDEITIDLAAIEKIKTITISQNRLIFGNITTVNLVNDRGATTISGGNFTRQVGVKDSFSSDLFTSRYKGLFRGEVYRYAISYYDKYGNFSAPTTLDLSSISENQITGGLKDLKVPKRWQSGGQYTIFDSSNNTQSIGLVINNISNHPSWAKGFIILRAKRKKDIAFQSPLLPMSGVFSPGALSEYPTRYISDNNSSDTSFVSGVTALDVNLTKPAGPIDIYTAPNLFSGAATSIVKYDGLPFTGTNPLKRIINTSINIFDKPDLYMCFPDGTMYTNDSKFQYNNETITPVDSCTTRLFFTRFEPVNNKYGGQFEYGRSINSSISGSFFASRNNDYYYHFGNSKGADFEVNRTLAYKSIIGHKNFDNLDEGSFVGGKEIFSFSKLKLTNLNFGFLPTTQRCTVLLFNNKIAPLTDATVGLSLIVNYNSGVPDIIPNQYLHPIYGSIPDPSKFGLSSNGTNFGENGELYNGVINKIEIVNVIRGLLDSRYGELNSNSEYIYTGTQVEFTNAETITLKTSGNLPKTVTVWGGDCIVSPHTFKISDSIYTVATVTSVLSLSTIDNTNLSAAAFEKAWNSNSGGCIATPVAIKNAAQFLTVVLESEYHGSVRDKELVDNIGTYEFPIKGSTTETKLRAPLSYRYNTLSKQNDQKIFTPIDPTTTYNK